MKYDKKLKITSDRIGPFKNLEAVDVSTCKGGGVYLSSGRALVKEIEKYFQETTGSWLNQARIPPLV